MAEMIDDASLRLLSELERKVLWLSAWTIHNANHLRPSADGLKVGGHQASSASMSTILTALYLAVLKPEDRVAVKPHASPAWHALQYLLGRQSRAKLEDFRALGGAQSYPSRTKDTDDVDFSTGSVGLGVAQTLFSSLVQDYVRAHGWASDRPCGRMVALLGDAELDEGNIFEALLEGWKHGLRKTWWVVDYNRQSLDAVSREGLWERLDAAFHAVGWDVVILKYGSLQQAAFREPGGEALRAWIDACPNPLYSALVFQGGTAWRKRLTAEIGDDPAVAALIARRSDDELAALMGNLGGHDLPTLLAAFAAAREHDRPTCFIAYTIKGHGLPLAGHRDNHAGLMTMAQMETLRSRMKVRPGREWDPFEGLDAPEAELRRFLDDVPFVQGGPRRLDAPTIPVPDALDLPAQAVTSTQQAFGQILTGIARTETEMAARIVTCSPDVTVSTNLGGWVNRRGLYGREVQADVFREERIPSTNRWEFSPQGQHVELGIAEMNLFTLLAGLGLSRSLDGVRLLPIGTLYDPFICRGLDALNYACYQDARFIVVATPSGLTLAPEGGAHQSIGTPLIGMAQPGLASFEPAYADELAVILRHALDYIQREGDPEPDPATGLAEGEGGSVYLRLSTRSIEQPQRRMDEALARSVVAGGYWMRPPGPNPELVVVYSGAVAPEAIEAVGLIAEDRRDVGLLAVTSADRLHAGWSGARWSRRSGIAASCHAERLLEGVPRHCPIVTVCDGHPAMLSWIGGVHGHRVEALGVESFGQSGTVPDLYALHGLDAAAIMAAAEALFPARPIRLRSVV